MRVSSLIATCALLVGASANPTFNTRPSGTPNSSGVHNGFFYSWFSDTGNNATYVNEDAGTYSIQWSSMAGHFSGGKGWSPGTRGRVINYNGTYLPNGHGIIGVYGWTRSPLVEYYLAESYGTHNPAAGATRAGSTSCINNGVLMRYDIYQTTRYNQPSIDGIQTFKQFWSIRTNIAGRTGVPIKGTVDTECHFKAWSELGMEIGEEMVYQLFATEGWYSSGKVSVTIS